MYNIIQLNDKDLSELQQIAKELGLKKTDSLKKEELVYRILDEQAIVGATKKVAAQQNNEERKEGQPRKRSRISVKKEGDKVYTATKDKAQKLEATHLPCQPPLLYLKKLPLRLKKQPSAHPRKKNQLSQRLPPQQKKSQNPNEDGNQVPKTNQHWQEKLKKLKRNKLLKRPNRLHFLLMTTWNFRRLT